METLAIRYARLQTEMQTLRSGDSLAAAADAVEGALPHRPLVLVSTSDEGAGLAAVCAASRGVGTSWMKVNLLAPQFGEENVEVVVVEPIHAGVAWRQAVDRIYPGARILIVSELLQTVPGAGLTLREDRGPGRSRGLAGLIRGGLRLQRIRERSDHLGVRLSLVEAGAATCSAPSQVETGSSRVSPAAARAAPSARRAIEASRVPPRISDSFERHRLDLIVRDRVSRVGVELRELPW